jgi:Cu(I)/Ag(I) efflux system membrane fusion protein
MATVVRTTGAVRYDETRQSRRQREAGWMDSRAVHRLHGTVRPERAAALLALQPDLLLAQNEYLLALKTRDQLKDSAIADAREYAGRVVDAARQRLVSWDLQRKISPRSRKRGRRAIHNVSLADVRLRPRKAGREGHAHHVGQSLYKIADLSVVWVEADVYEQEIAQVHVGQRAQVTLDAYPGESFDGRAIYVYPFVQENTRTVKVRFQFANPRLRSSRVCMQRRTHLARHDGVDVPANAVLDSGHEQGGLRRARGRHVHTAGQ